MSTHDVLAYAVATEAVRRLRAASAPWNTLFSPSAYITASRAWPVPDFVLVDDVNNIAIGAEFKPPGQTKREYLTGLGQAIAYSKDFDYSLLVLPEIADDHYQISRHVVDVLNQPSMSHVPSAGRRAYLRSSNFLTSFPEFQRIPFLFAPGGLTYCPCEA